MFPRKSTSLVLLFLGFGANLEEMGSISGVRREVRLHIRLQEEGKIPYWPNGMSPPYLITVANRFLHTKDKRIFRKQ